jgi:hypothetical protein
MIRRRDKPDGLPYRLYERYGVRRYSIGYKGKDGAWLWRMDCPVADAVAVADLRRQAIARAAQVGAQVPPPPDDSFSALAGAWLAWQDALPPSSSARRAESTLAENRRELDMLKKAFGHMPCSQIEKADAYAYLDACLVARDKAKVLRPRPEKGNKEIALARAVLEWGVRRRWLPANPFVGVEKLTIQREARYVADHELALAQEVGRRMGGPQAICALALQTAWLCVRRSVEVRALTRDQITEAGIEWKAAKRQRGESVKLGLIEWSPELRATIDQALAIKRHKLAGAWYVFGNLNGQRYTKGGWKATLAKLMTECEAEAARRKIAFRAFSLQDCRPKGVSDKMARGDTDTVDATLHSSERMVRQVYDRRRVRVAKPAG